VKDKIVEEIRARRRQLVRGKYDGSVDRFVGAAIAWDGKHPDRVIHAGRKHAVTV